MGEIVKKSNALARTCWSAESILEPRLIALLASKININDVDFKIYNIHISEIIGNAHSGQDYLDVARAVENVMSRVITISDPDSGDWTKYNVFSRCRFRKKEGILELGFHPDLIPHYLQLKKNFVQYNLIEYLTLSSLYSQKVFEILKSWANRSEITILIPELHVALSVPESLRIDFAAFRRRALEKAYKDINEKTSLRYEWEAIKTKNKVTAIRFIFSQKDRMIVQKATIQKLTDKFIAEQARPGETWEEARDRLSNRNRKLFE